MEGQCGWWLVVVFGLFVVIRIDSAGQWRRSTARWCCAEAWWSSTSLASEVD